MVSNLIKSESNFKHSQELFVENRLTRINDTVVPKLKALSSHVDVKNINRFAKLACDVYNDNLPVNDKKITSRTITQNPQYWSILGTVYFKYFEHNEDKVKFKDNTIKALKVHEINELNERIERLEKENKALKAAFSGIEINKEPESIPNSTLIEIDNLCRIIHELIKSHNGIVKVNIKDGTIKDESNDLEEYYGMLPKEVIKPYITWLKKREDVLGSENE